MIHLTGQNYSARELVQNIFTPLVGVIGSPLANELCQRNNLSFVELLQPFAKLPTDAVFRDVSGTSVSIRGLRLNFTDIDYRPPQTMVARKMLNEAVANAQHVSSKIVRLVVNGNPVEVEVPVAEPWYENWRETFLTVQFPAEHEFTRHLLSCLIVLSSNDPNIVESAMTLTHRLQQLQNVIPQKLPKWFQPNDVLNSYVLLHEACHADLLHAQHSYEQLKSHFGDSKCFLIQINSLNNVDNNVDIPDYWSAYIKRHPKNNNDDKLQQQQQQQPQQQQPTYDITHVQQQQQQQQQQQLNLTIESMSTSTESEISVSHPLSPVQEHGTDALHSAFSLSTESLVSSSGGAPAQGGVHEHESDVIYGGCLNSMDIENLRHFVQDYAVRALIPYVERLVASLNEAITNRKGVSKSLLSATKRWFVTSKPTAGTNNQNAVIYTYESAELQTRRLGDLYFMFGHYSLAYQSYHQAKRDFNADSAWQYYSGALEMAALSAFMLGTANRKTYDYMENAIVCYLTVCKLQQLATRATLLSIECLKTARLYNEAAKQLMRMTSEESDLRSALLLEQAAYCYLACQPAMHRKYAFHIVLAGNRYSRAGQRKHAFRCYRQASQVFAHHDWSLAEDHIQYTMAKHAYALKRLEDASACYTHLLRPGSQQNAQQMAIFCREYIQTQNEYLLRHPNVGLLNLAAPQLEQDSVRVLVSAEPCTAYPLQVAANNIDINSNLKHEPLWHKMEEMMAITANDNKPFVFKPTQSLFSRQTPCNEQPLAVQGESIVLSVSLYNSMKCSLILTNVELLWKLRLENETELTNLELHDSTLNVDTTNTAAINAAVKSIVIPHVLLEEQQRQTIYFKLTPKLSGELSIIGILATIAPATEPQLKLQGALYFKLNDKKTTTMTTTTTTTTTATTTTVESFIDNILNLRIVPQLPAINVSFTQIPEQMMAGEMYEGTMSLRNLGISPIEQIYVACDSPRWLIWLHKHQQRQQQTEGWRDASLMTQQQEKLTKEKEIRRQHVAQLLGQEQNEKLFEIEVLKPQEALQVPFCIQAPYRAGQFNLRLLVYYGITGDNNKSRFKYRLVRHTWKFQVHESLQADVACVLMNSLAGELGLDVTVQNQHENSEFYVDNLSFSSTHYLLNEKKFFLMNQTAITRGQYGERCLQPNQVVNFQCGLTTRQNIISENVDQIEEYISKLTIMPSTIIMGQQQHHHNNHHITKTNNDSNLKILYSFLMKHEANMHAISINTEAFNNLNNYNHAEHYNNHNHHHNYQHNNSNNQHHQRPSIDNRHTVVLRWSVALLSADNRQTMQRFAHGVHFIRLIRIYAMTDCFNSNVLAPQNMLPNLPTLSECYERSLKRDFDDIIKADEQLVKKMRQLSDNVDDQYDDDEDEDEDDNWEPNAQNVSSRCLLEDVSASTSSNLLRT